MCSPKLGSKERKRATESQTSNREWQGVARVAAAAWRDPAVWETKRALGENGIERFSDKVEYLRKRIMIGR